MTLVKLVLEGDKVTQYSDVNIRERTRICFAYGLTPRIPVTTPGKCINETHDYGRLSSHIESGRDLLPRVLIDEQIISPDSDRSDIRPLSAFPPMHTACVILTMTPRGGIVLVIDGELGEPNDGQAIAELLAKTCFTRKDIQLDGLPITKWVLAKLQETGVQVDSLDFGNDVHQCVFPGNFLQEKFWSQEDPQNFNQMVAQILYRGTVPVDSGSLLGINVPPGLNNPGNTFVAHGRGVSIFTGWTVHLENAFILTAISTVSALGALRLCRHEAFSAMALAQNAALASTRNARALVSQLSDRVNEMHLDLSFGVETHIDPLLIPELVVESFQRSISQAVGIHESLENTSRMLQRVSVVISARLAKLEAGDRERIERRDRLVAILVAVATLLALPPALLLAFFGITAPQVHPADSIFNLHVYWGAYALAWLPFVILVTVGSTLYTQIRRRGAADLDVAGS